MRRAVRPAWLGHRVPGPAVVVAPAPGAGSSPVVGPPPGEGEVEAGAVGVGVATGATEAARVPVDRRQRADDRLVEAGQRRPAARRPRPCRPRCRPATAGPGPTRRCGGSSQRSTSADVQARRRRAHSSSTTARVASTRIAGRPRRARRARWCRAGRSCDPTRSGRRGGGRPGVAPRRRIRRQASSPSANVAKPKARRPSAAGYAGGRGGGPR